MKLFVRSLWLWALGFRDLAALIAALAGETPRRTNSGRG